jgi:succinate dehydrogenase/fumarate reductase cytochrome b subunit
MLIKRIAGVLMFLLGLVILLLILLINSGHTSSDLSTGDDILGSIFGLILLAGGVYAMVSRTPKK